MLTISLITLYFMILVIIYNFFCYTIGLESMQLKAYNIKKIFALEIIFGFIYTYLGHLLTLFLMQNKDMYKKTAIFCLPFTILTMVLTNFVDGSVINIIVIFFYFFYCYMLSQNIKTIAKCFSYLVLIFIIQMVFYYFKYVIFKIPFMSIDSELLKALMNFDYYLFLTVIIVIKTKLIKR